MKSILIAAAVTLILSACGGGVSRNSVDNSSAINAAIPAIADTLPAPKPFTGAYVILQGESLGYVAGASPRAIVEAVAGIVKADPVKYAVMYQAMLSDAGLKVTIVGEATGTSSVTGLPIYAPNVVWTVKLTNGGIVIFQ